MGEKEGNSEENKKNGGGGGDLGKKDDSAAVVIILKADLHCEGCATKIRKAVRGLEGVETATADLVTGKLAVTGKVDPWRLRDLVEEKTRRKVDLISPKNPGPPPKKLDAAAATTAVVEQKKKKITDINKKAKEPPAAVSTTVVLKIRLHCEGCIQRIRKTVLGLKGVQSVSIDAAKDLVTVKGTMKDPAGMPEALKVKLNRNVEIVPPPKAGGGVEKQEKGGGDTGKKSEDAVAAMSVPVAEANKMDYLQWPAAPPRGYGRPPVEMMLHAPQIFSDENPNACSVM